MRLYPAAEANIPVCAASAAAWDLCSWREVFHGGVSAALLRADPVPEAPGILSQHLGSCEEDEWSCALLKHRTWPGFRKALKHMLKPSPFLSRDVFVTRAPTTAGPMCRGVVEEWGIGYPQEGNPFGAGAIPSLLHPQGTLVPSTAIPH